MPRTALERLVDSPAKGILATDETTLTLAGRMAEFGMPAPTHPVKLAYRELLYGTPELPMHLVGIILLDDMFGEHTSEGEPFVRMLRDAGLLVGVTADQGRTHVGEHSVERVTLGLEGLDDRLSRYQAGGAAFCKWRAEFRIGPGTPSDGLLRRNASDLASFAAACLGFDLVPLMEPDVVMQGAHDLQACRDTTLRVLEALFAACRAARIDTGAVGLKLHMVTPGAQGAPEPPERIAGATLDALKAVPEDVPFVAFLSGGQSETDANRNLAAICDAARTPATRRRFTFSFGRSLQREALAAWRGHPENVPLARHALVASLKRAAEASAGGNVTDQRRSEMSAAALGGATAQR